MPQAVRPRAEGGRALPNVGLGLLVAALFAVSACLMFARLGSAALWDDEAGVAIFARNFLHFHQLTGWDGRNLYGYRNGTLLDRHLVTINPPLEYLVAALSFRLLGISALTARLPFALLGVATLVLFRRMLCRRVDEEVPRLYMFALLTLSTAFVLYVRTCRYYAPCFFLTLLCGHAFYLCLLRHRVRDFAVLASAAILLFFSNYLICAAFLLSLVVVLLLFYPRAWNRRGWCLALMAAGAFLLVTLPYGAGHHIWRRPDIASPEPWLPHRLTLIWWNLRDLNLLGSLPWIGSAVAVAVLIQGRQRRGATEGIPPVQALMRDSLALIVAYAIALGVLSPQPTTVPTVADLRYLSPVIPWCAALLGGALWHVHQRTKVGGMLLLLAMTCTNALGMTPGGRDAFPGTQQFRWILPAYLGEIKHPYPTCDAAAADYLRLNAGQDDLVWSAPDYFDLPLMFSAGDRVRICGQLDRQTTPLRGQAVRALPTLLYADQSFPNWVILFGADPVSGQALAYFSRLHLDHGKRIRWTYRLSAVLPIYCGQSQRPELPWHHFGPVKDFDVNSEAVYVFRQCPAASGPPPGSR